MANFAHQPLKLAMTSRLTTCLQIDQFAAQQAAPTPKSMSLEIHRLTINNVPQNVSKLAHDRWVFRGGKILQHSKSLDLNSNRHGFKTAKLLSPPCSKAILLLQYMHVISLGMECIKSLDCICCRHLTTKPLQMKGDYGCKSGQPVVCVPTGTLNTVDMTPADRTVPMNAIQLQWQSCVLQRQKQPKKSPPHICAHVQCATQRPTQI